MVSCWFVCLSYVHIIVAVDFILFRIVFVSNNINIEQKKTDNTMAHK